MTTFIDRRGHPAVRTAFGYSRTDPRTTTMLFVSNERLVLERMTDDEVRCSFVETSLPPQEAIRKLKEVMATGGASLEARRLMWFLDNEPVWMLKLMDALIALKCTLRRTVAVSANEARAR